MTKNYNMIMWERISGVSMAQGQQWHKGNNGNNGNNGDKDNKAVFV